jgi:hypothetical protein
MRPSGAPATIGAMSTIQNQSLTLQPSAAGVTVTVAYAVTFSAIETFLMQSGLVIEERIQLFGVDDAPAGLTALWTTRPEPLVLPPGDKVLTRTRTFDMPRLSLQEDPTQPRYWYVPDYSGDVWWPHYKRVLIGYLPDDDELLARVQLTYAGLETLTEVDTPIALLRG